MSFGCSVLTRVFLKSCLVPPKREDMKPPYANKLDSRCFGFFCFFFFKKKKKEKERQRKRKQRMAVGNGNRKEMRPHCSWLLYWSGGLGRPRTPHGHYSTNCSYHLLKLFFSFFCISYLLTYIYIYIFFYTLRISLFQLFPYEYRCGLYWI